MRKASLRAIRHLALGIVAMLAGCGAQDRSATVGIVAIDRGAGGRNALFQQRGELGYPAQLVRSASAEGLVAFDADGRVIPALADRWIVLDDGQSYIFRLRDGTWKGGEPLTAASAQVALRAAIVALRGTSLALDLGSIESIRAMAGRVIEIRLRQPMPDLLQLLAQPELGLIRRDAGGGAGPMDLVRAEDTATLIPIDPEQLGLPEVADWKARVSRLKLVARPGAAAVRQFAVGSADLVLGGDFASYPLAIGIGGSRTSLSIDPVQGLFGLVVLNDRGVLATPAMREALAMAIDRDALAGALRIDGWAGTTRIVPAGVTDDPGTTGERWADLTLDERRRRARAILAAAQREDGAQGAATLRIALPQGPGADLLLARLHADLAAIGIDAVAAHDPREADLALLDEVARYPRTAWFLNALNCRVRHGLCDAGADALMDQVRLASDGATAARLQAEALGSFAATNVYIPLGAPVRWSLVRRGVTGFAPNATGLHPLMPLALKPT